MEVDPSQETSHEMPIPLNSTYGGHPHALMTHHHHHHDPPAASHNHIIIPSSAGPTADDITPFKKHTTVIRYRECLKNHAAAMGGSATDGCGEFMPSGEDGTLEALTCSACACHRNFHRKEIDGGGDILSQLTPFSDHNNCYVNPTRMGRKLFVGHHHAMGYGPLISSRAVAPPHHHQMMMSYNNNNMGGSSDEQEGAVVVRPPQVVKKRFRTKFTQEQKEKMMSFAERVGWKIQKQDEGVVQQFCQEVGVKRRVLKVWMHNNKHNLAKKANLIQPNSTPDDHENQV